MGTVKLWHERLDIEKRRSIQDINVADIKNSFLYSIELDDRYSDWVGPLRGSTRKDTSGGSIQERNDLQIEALALME